MMNFDEAWDTLAIGDKVSFSDGTRAPRVDPTSEIMSAWLSHNHSGTLIEKVTNKWGDRALRIELPPHPWGLYTLAFDVSEEVPHTFTPA